MIRPANRRPPNGTAAEQLRAAPDLWLRPGQIIERYGIGRTRLYTWLASGDLPSLKVGRTRHVRASDVEEFLERLAS